MSQGCTSCTYRYGHSYTKKMHLLLWMLIFLAINSARCSAAEIDPWRLRRAVGHSEQYLKQIFYAHANCTRTDWACNKDCRLEFADRITGLCVRPSPTETCFGVPIRYNFTVEAANVISVLPHYEVLSSFPRCWSVLGPLLCAVAYRPCSNRTYFEASMSGPGKMELWQVFRKEMCHRALERCGFLLENGLWPDFVDCSDTVEQKSGRRIFSNGSCKMPYNKEPSTMESKQCLWPLADGTGHVKPMSRPLIDDCYLSCRSPLISSQWLYDGFRMSVFCFSLLVVIGGVLCWLYLFAFSLLFIEDLCVYAFTHALLSASIHWFTWLLSYFDRLAERAMCFNMLRRDETVVRSLLDWCTIQSWVLHASILSGLFWLLVAIAIQIGRPKRNSDRCVKWNNHCNLRLLFLVCYLLAGSIASVGLWTNAVETDGVTGVCYLGLRSYNSAVQLYLPVLAFMLLLLAVVFIQRTREGSLFTNRASKRKSTNSTEQRDQVALFEEKASDDAKSGDYDNVRRNGNSQMSVFWLGLLCGTITFSIVTAMFVHWCLLAAPVLEQEVVLDSVRCSLNKTILEGQTDWLRGTVRDQQADIFTRRSSIGNSFLSARNCELATVMDDRLLPLFLVYLFFPSLPFLIVMLYVLVGFCGYGMTDVEKVRDKLNPFVLVKYPDVAVDEKHKKSTDEFISSISNAYPNKTGQSSDISLEMREDVKQSDSNDREQQESRDTFASDPKVRRLDVVQRSRERKQRYLESGFLFPRTAEPAHSVNKIPGQLYSPVWPDLQRDIRSAYYSLTSNNGADGNSEKDPMPQAAKILSAYQNGLIEGHWRERCVNYEKQIKALSANLRVADHEIRRLVGLETSVPNAAPSESSTFLRSRATLSQADSPELLQKPTCSRNVIVKTEPHAGGNKVEMRRTPPIIPQPSSGGTSLHSPPTKADDIDEHVSGNFSDSDSFNSDEEDSEEERQFNERVAELKRRQEQSN